MKKNIVWLTILGLILSWISVVTSEVLEISDDLYKNSIHNSENPWFLMFYADWCHSCSQLKPLFDDVEKRLSTEGKGPQGLRMGKINVEVSQGTTARYMVTRIPSLFYIHNKEAREYRGSRDPQALIEFLESGNWQTLPKLSFWKNPFAFPARIVGYGGDVTAFVMRRLDGLHDRTGISYPVLAVGTVGAGFAALLITFQLCLSTYGAVSWYNQAKSSSPSETKRSKRTAVPTAVQESKKSK